MAKIYDIARSAARLRLIVFTAMGLIVLLYLAARLGLQIGRARVEYHAHMAANGSTWFIADAGVALLVVALLQLTQMLGRIASGELFSVGVVRSFRSFAFWLLLTALLGLFGPPLNSLLQMKAGDGHAVRFAIDFREVLTVGVTSVLFLLARLLERARLLDEEMREIV